MGIVIGPAARLRKAKAGVQSDRRSVRFANFQKHFADSVFRCQQQESFQQKFCMALAPMRLRNGQIQDFGLRLDLPPLQNADHFPVTLTNVNPNGSRSVVGNGGWLRWCLRWGLVLRMNAEVCFTKDFADCRFIVRGTFAEYP